MLHLNHDPVTSEESLIIGMQVDHVRRSGPKGKRGRMIDAFAETAPQDFIGIINCLTAQSRIFGGSFPDKHR